MKTILKLFLLLLSILIVIAIYLFLTFPDKEKIVTNLKSKYSKSITPDKSNYDSLVNIEIKENQSILLREVKSAEMYNNTFPIFTHKFEFHETESIINILNDSTNFSWGEIGTPYYDKTIVFLDNSKNEIGYVEISFDGQINMFPNLAVTKCGLLNDKGFKELVIAIRTE